MKCPKCTQEMTPKRGGYTCFGCGFKIEKSDIFELKPEEFSHQMFRCATCDNNITELKAMKFPICDECMKDLREIIKERRGK